MSEEEREHMREETDEEAIARMTGVPLERVGEYIAKDRFLLGMKTLKENLEIVKGDIDLIAAMDERYTFNEREQVTMANIVSTLDRIGMRGAGCLALVTAIQIGIEVGRMQKPEYTEEDHQTWVNACGPSHPEHPEHEEYEKRVAEGVDTLSNFVKAMTGQEPDHYDPSRIGPHGPGCDCDFPDDEDASEPTEGIEDERPTNGD